MVKRRRWVERHLSPRRKRFQEAGNLDVATAFTVRCQHGENICLVYHHRASTAAKWRKEAFKHFIVGQYFVAACNRFFNCAQSARGKNFATRRLKCEKERLKMWTFKRQIGHNLTV